MLVCSRTPYVYGLHEATGDWPLAARRDQRLRDRLRNGIALRFSFIGFSPL